MKHLLNDLSEEEKNRIREQHTGGKKIMIENFNKLVNTKLGDARPLTEQEVVPQTDNEEELENEIKSLKDEIDVIKKDILSSRKENLQDKKAAIKNKLIEIYNKYIAFIDKIEKNVKQNKKENLEKKRQELINKRDELKNSGDVLTINEKLHLRILLAGLIFAAGSVLLPGSGVYKALQSLSL